MNVNIIRIMNMDMRTEEDIVDVIVLCVDIESNALPLELCRLCIWYEKRIL